MKTKLFLYLFLSLWITAPHSYGQGITIFRHFGAADPTTEGFSLYGNVSASPIVGDSGRDALSVRIGINEIAQFSHSLTPQQQADAATAGWIMSLTLRVLEPLGASNFGGGIFARLFTGSSSFGVSFGAQSDGDPIMRLGNTQYALENFGAGYHNYQFIYDPVTELVRVNVNETHLTDVVTASNPSTAQLTWGGGQHPGGIWHAHWNEVSFTIIPEPSTFALFSIGGLSVAAFLLKRRNN